MTLPASLRGVLMLGAGLLAAGAGNGAQAQDTLHMTVSARPGQTGWLTARTEAGLLLFTGSGEPWVLDMYNEGTQRIEAQSVAADGTLTWSTRLAHLLYERDGETLVRFDARDPEGDIGNTEPLRAMRAIVQQEADGRVRDFHVESADPQVRAVIERALEDSIAHSVLLFPREPIPIGHSWPIGKRTMPFPGIGRVEYQMTATLQRVLRPAGGPTRAELVLEASDARFTADPDSKLTGKLTSLRLRGEATYDIDGRFLRSQEIYGFLSIVGSDPAGGDTSMQMYMRVFMEEGRDP